jgi:glycosyltransferase involved in cell wall biosynthesis
MTERRRPDEGRQIRPTPGYVCFSAQDWWYFNRAHSDFQLMREVAASRPVLLVNSIGMRMPVPGTSTRPFRRIARKARSMVRRLCAPVPGLPGFHVLTPFFLPIYGDGRARRLNVRLIRWQVERAARRLGLIDPVIVVTLPTAGDVAEGMDRGALVFNRSDKYSAFDEADTEWVTRLEHELLETADSVVYASRALLEAERHLAGDRAVFLDHGVDLDHFSVTHPGSEPLDLHDIPRPRIGFFGAIDDYTVDLELLEEIARALPDVHLVLVGAATCALPQLEALPNVHWLGYRPYEEIPRYGAGFDVALMPWLDNEWIRHSNPIKLKEYLALGLPIVSTDFPEAHHYQPWVRVARSPEQFVALVRQTLLDGGPGTAADRRAAVQDASWTSRAEQLIAVCERREVPAECAAS